MITKIVAIGGGENGRILENGQKAPYDTKRIDEEIIKLTGKKNPHFLFMAHAMPTWEIQESYYQTMQKIYGEKFGCICQDLKKEELDDLSKTRKKIAWADIIYEGGGDTGEMLRLWQDKGFISILTKACQEGKVISGISAGAVCWFKSCNSDKDDKTFESVDCLNWYNLHVTPHCDEPGRIASTKKQLNDNNLIGLMLSNGAALEIVADNYRIITSKKEAYALKAYWENNIYKEEKLKVNNFYPIKELLAKNIK